MVHDRVSVLSQCLLRECKWETCITLLFLSFDNSFNFLLLSITIGPNEEFLKNGSYPLLTIDSAGHALHVFVNGQLSGRWNRVTVYVDPCSGTTE